MLLFTDVVMCVTIDRYVLLFIDVIMCVTIYRRMMSIINWLVLMQFGRVRLQQHRGEGELEGIYNYIYFIY